MGSQRARLAAVGAVFVLALLGAGIAAGASAAPDVAVAPFATGFPSDSNGIGPTGMAFDTSGRLFVADRGRLYRFGPTGGRADADHQVNRAGLPGVLAGLALGRDGNLYAALRRTPAQGDVVELNQQTGQVARVVASGISCPTGLAVDPLSGDLFVSSVYCSPQVTRIHNGQKSTYVSGVAVDGMAFAPNGTLYLAHSADLQGYTVSSVPGTNSSDRTRTGLSKVDEPDGIGVAATDATSGAPPFLIVNRLNGSITRIDLTAADHPTRDLVTGGTRGDFVVVGGDGCLYATQTSEVLKVTNADGSCSTSNSGDGGGGGLGGLVPTAPPLSASAYVKVSGGSAKAKACVASRRLTVRFRSVRGKRVRRARLYIGKKRVRTVSGRALRRKVTLTKLPKRAFTLTIRATTTKGKRLVVRRRYKACAGTTVKPKKKKAAKKKRSRRRS